MPKRLKVKLFYSDHCVSVAEAEVNKWIESNSDLEIQEIKVTGAGSQHAQFMISITYLEYYLE
jgi:hypothetical protein